MDKFLIFLSLSIPFCLACVDPFPASYLIGAGEYIRLGLFCDIKAIKIVTWRATKIGSVQFTVL